MFLTSCRLQALALPVWVMVWVLAGALAAHSQEARSPPDGSAASQLSVKEGHALFNQTCAHCHGPDAATGLPERNLRRLRVRYGDDMHSVFETTVMNGRPDKGMPVWSGVLDAKTIESIYDYLETIQEDGD